MWFSSWLRSRKQHESPRKRPTFRPTLEALEGRLVPTQIGLSVTSLADSGPGTLRAAILAADAGSHSDKFKIGFAVTGTIDLQSPLPDLNNNIAIRGPGQRRLTVEQAAGASFTSAIVTVGFSAGTQTASLAGLTIANGSAGGIVNNGTLTVSDCTVSGNTASDSGGGIDNEGTLIVSGCTLSNNSAVVGGGIFTAATLEVSGCTLSGNVGGGIYNNAGVATVMGSAFTGNSATAGLGGGGISNQYGQMTVANSTFSGNSAPAGLHVGAPGGAIFNNGLDFFTGAATTMTVRDCTLSGNSATEGGAIEDANNTTVTISRCTLSGNSATRAGGAIFNGGTLTVSGCTLSGNSAAQGGGIFNQSSLVVGNSVFTGNSATKGGGIFNGGTLTVRDSLLTSNSATFGGGIYNDSLDIFGTVFFGTVTVTGSTFTGNTASDSGGGIYNLGTATVRDSILARNSAGSDGGGIFNGASGKLTVKDSVVRHNVALLGADLYNAGVVFVGDSIIGSRHDI